MIKDKGAPWKAASLIVSTPSGMMELAIAVKANARLPIEVSLLPIATVYR
jgi:hypothetical protein